MLSSANSSTLYYFCFFNFFYEGQLTPYSFNRAAVLYEQMSFLGPFSSLECLTTTWMLLAPLIFYEHVQLST